MSLQEISEATEIHSCFLEALENNAFDELPADASIEGYIRSYAYAVGLDDEEILNVYKEFVELGDYENSAQTTFSFDAQPKNLAAKSLLLFAVVGLLSGVGFLIKNEMGNSSRPAAEKKIPLLQTQQEHSVPVSRLSEQLIERENADAKKTSPPRESVAPTTRAANILPLGLDTQNPASVGKLLRLSIQAKETSWFNITVDDFREEDFILLAGTAKTFHGDEKIRVTVGDKTAVELFLNGNDLVLPKSDDKMVKDFFIDSKLAE